MKTTNADGTPATHEERRAGGEYADHPRVLEAARSARLFELSVGAALKHFRLNHTQVRAARTIALATRPKASAEAQRRREMGRLHDKAVAAEAKYPLIHRKLCQGASMSSVGTDYHLSRMRACQLKKQFESIVHSGESDSEQVLTRVERDARTVRRPAKKKSR